MNLQKEKRLLSFFIFVVLLAICGMLWLWPAHAQTINICITGGTAVPCPSDAAVGGKKLQLCMVDVAAVPCVRPERPPIEPIEPPTGVVAFDCSAGFSSSGSCGVQFPSAGGEQKFWASGSNGMGLSGNQVNLIPANLSHIGASLIYQTQVDARAFKSTFTFVPNGQNVAFVVQNSTNNPAGFNGKHFSGGAGCEAGFFQGWSQPEPPDRVFALELDSYSPLVASSWDFVYSSVQIYRTDTQPPGNVAPGQSPCIPGEGGTNYHYVGVDKLSTSPVALNSPSNKQNTTTGHVYSATTVYDGSKLTLSMYDVTADGVCPGETCYTHTWTGIDIPTAVGGSMAWVGIVAATGISGISPLLINTWTYSTP